MPLSRASHARAVTVACLAVLYLVWGSTYLAMRVAVQSFAPLQMASLRFASAGLILYLLLRACGAAAPTLREWQACAAIGALVMAIGLGGVSIAVTHVSSGVAALVFGSVPLWTALFGRAFGQRLRGREAVGMFLGFAGVVLVATRGALRGEPFAAAILCASAASYSFGCVLARRLSLPRGAMATAAQMIAAGVALAIGSLVRGEALPSHVSSASAFALAYLVLFGSMIAYCAFNHLLRTERASLATSYAFVNPIVALALGALFGGESFARADVIGVSFVVAAVVVVASGAWRWRKGAELRRAEITKA